MRQHDRRSNLVEQGGAGILIALLRYFVGDHGLDLRGVERIEDRIPLLPLARAVAWPLGMLLRLRPGSPDRIGGKLEFLLLGGEHARRAVARMPGGAAAHRLVDHVDDVALLDEILGPAFAPIRRSHPVGRGLRRAWMSTSG